MAEAGGSGGGNGVLSDEEDKYLPKDPSAGCNFGAIELAMRNAATRGERCIFEPTTGTIFSSVTEAYEFFNMYSWEVGFGVSYGRSRKNDSRRRTRQDIVCSCEVTTRVEGQLPLGKEEGLPVRHCLPISKTTPDCDGLPSADGTASYGD